MAQTFYNYSFRFLNDSNEVYKLRKSEITAAQVLYRVAGSSTTFTTTFDFNIDEQLDTLWVRLPAGDLEFVITLNVSTLRTITTGLTTLTFGQLTTNYDVQATPVPLNSKQGYSPRILNDFWYEYDDVNQTFVNTGYSAKGTVIPETVQVDDFLLLGDVNPVTSNAVKVETNRLQAQITSNTNTIEQNSEAIQSLSEHKVSVTLNDTTTEEDTNGNIALGTIQGLDKLYRVQGEYDIATLSYYGVDKKAIVEQGGLELNSHIEAGSYGKYYSIPTGTGTYYRIMGTIAQTNPAIIRLRISSGSNTVAGTIFIGMEDNISTVYCDNVLLQKYIYCMAGGSSFQGLYIKAMSDSMQRVQAYCSNFAFLDDEVSLYSGDTTLMIPVSYGLATNKTWIEIYDTPFVISQLESELDLSVNIPAVTLTLPSDLTYPQTIVVKNIQGAACTLSATGYTDMVLDDQTINYITLTSPTGWTKVSTKNEAGAQGIKYIGKDTVYAIDAQGIINIPYSFQCANMGISFTTMPNTVYLANQYIELFLYNGVPGIVYCNFVGDPNGSFSFNCPDVEDANFTFTYNGSALTYNGTKVSSKGKRTHIDVSKGVIVGMYTPSEGGNVSTGGLSMGHLTKAVGDKKIGYSIFTEDTLSKDEDILFSLLDGLLTYKCDGATVTNGVTKKANKMVTTAYSVTSIATGAIMNIEHGDPFLITSDAAKMAGRMRLDDADMTNADSHGGWIAGSTNLTETTLPSTAYAFSYAQFFKGCTNLKNVYFSPGGLELITSMYQMFMNCTNGPAYFYGGEPCAATNWRETFANSGVTLIDLTGSGCAGLTTMERFAENCKSLETLNLTNFNFGKSACSLMLSGCVSLKHVTLKGAKTEGISACYKMFYNCEKLVTLDFGTTSVPATKNCEYMFAGCKALTTLDVSTFLPASMTYCYKIFDNCTSINSLALPTGWCNTVDLGYMVALSQSSIAAIATALASGVKDRVITFDATIYAAIPAAVVSTITGKGWSVLTVTY